MQTLDARHIELFLCEGYQSGSWDYDLVGCHDLKKRADGATGSIIDVKHLESSSTSGKLLYFKPTYQRSLASLMFFLKN